MLEFSFFVLSLSKNSAMVSRNDFSASIGLTGPPHMLSQRVELYLVFIILFISVNITNEVKTTSRSLPEEIA